MGFILSAENVVEFLQEKQVCSSQFQLKEIVNKESKNFNLVVRGEGFPSYLVKQNRVDSKGRTSGHLITEWLLQELIHRYDYLAPIQPLISEVALFDRPNSVLVSVYYDDYMALDDYYETAASYPPQVASAVGSNLATVHRATYEKQELKDFLGQYFKIDNGTKPPGFIRRLNSLSPAIFGEVCPDGLTFYKLYQRFPSLNESILELFSKVEPSCLTHNDLTLDNFIIQRSLLGGVAHSLQPEQVKIIDWELIYWADPATDLGMLVSQYLGEWLNSLVADPNLDLNTILSLASCPLETITPSLQALALSYLETFPEILSHRPDFLRRIVQHAGIGIINRLSYYVEYHYPFDNENLCKLQVAKNLLCNPEASMVTLFGKSEAQLKQHAKDSNQRSLART